MENLSALMRDSFAAVTAAAETMTPLQQRDALYKQAVVEIDSVRAALLTLRSEAAAQHQPATPMSSPPHHPPSTSRSPQSPQKGGQRHASPSDTSKAKLSRQAIVRHQLARITAGPVTRGLLPTLPTSVVYRANYKVRFRPLLSRTVCNHTRSEAPWADLPSTHPHTHKTTHPLTH